MTHYFCRFVNDTLQAEEGFDSCSETLARESVTVFMQGIMKGRSLQTILDEYDRSGTFGADGLEGNFIVGIIDDFRKKVLLYRHLVGSYHVFYVPSSQGFCFGSNLAAVARRSGLVLKTDENMLPVFFIYRVVPGMRTLFEGVFKLLPGELLTWEGGRTERTQLVTVTSLLEPHRMDENEAVERINTVLREILSDCHHAHPNTAVLLSGGVDSTILQVHWNAIWKERHHDKRPPSAAVVLNHPHTKIDSEYTMSAVEYLQTDHCNVVQEPLTIELMNRVFNASGLMPDHVQSFYFVTLAEGMKKAGFSAGICGGGADGMFGNGEPQDLQDAYDWIDRIPLAFARYLLGCFINLCRPGNRMTKSLNLANHVSDWDYVYHPQNKAGAFTDFERVENVFGKEKMEEAMRYRRALLDVLRVPDGRNDPEDPCSFQRALLIECFSGGIETAAIWTDFFHAHDLEMFHPFLDSRLIRVACNIHPNVRFMRGRVKGCLKSALAKHVPNDFIDRPKRGFGQPVFEWLSPGGTLYPAVQGIGDYPWLPKKTKQDILEREPNWFLWSLLCYDLLYKNFVS